MDNVTVLKKKKKCSIEKTIGGKLDLVKKNINTYYDIFKTKNSKNQNFWGKFNGCL